MPYKTFTGNKKNGNRRPAEHNAHENLISEGVTDSLVITRSVILCGKNAGSGKSAENAQVKDEQQLIHNRYAAHLLGAYPADHDVVKQAHKISDARLYHYRHGYRQHPAVKLFIAYEFFSETHSFPSCFHFILRKNITG